MNNTIPTGVSFSLAFALAALEALGIKNAAMYHIGNDSVIGDDKWNTEETVVNNYCQYTHFFEIQDGEKAVKYVIHVGIEKETDISSGTKVRTYTYTGLTTVQAPMHILLGVHFNAQKEHLDKVQRVLVVRNKK